MPADRFHDLRRAALDDTFHDRGDLIGGQRIEHLLTIVDEPGLILVGPFHRLAILADALVVPVKRLAETVLDAVDQCRLDALAAIGQHRIGRHHAQHGRLAGTQRHRGDRQHIVIDAKAPRIFGNERQTHIARETHGHEVLGMLDAIAQGMRPGRLAVVVFRPPDPDARSHINFDGRIQNDRGGRIAIVERCGIDKGLEGRARLALALRCAVELRLVEGETANH